MNAKTNIWQLGIVIAMIIVAVVWLTISRSASIPIDSGQSQATSSQSNPIIIDQSQDQLPQGAGASLQQGSAAPGGDGGSVNPQQSLSGM